MRCFVTGATGYIGRHLVRHLRENGQDVTAVVRRRERTKPDPVSELTELGVEVIEGDLLDERLIDQTVAGAEVVFYLAWQTNRPNLPEVSGGSGQDQWRANMGGMQTLIAASKRAGISRFIFTSTAAIYGNAQGTAPLREEDALKSVDGIRGRHLADYLAPKIAAEKMLAEQLPKPDYVTLRLSVVYGPHAPGAVEIVRHAMMGPRSSRPPHPVQRLHIKDAVKSLMLAISRPDAANQTINIAGNESVESVDYMDALRQIAVWIRQGRPPEGHYASFALQPMRYDMTRARKYLGFHSSVPLMDGLEEMIEAALPSIAASGAALPQRSWQPTFAPGRFGGGWRQRPLTGGQWSRRGESGGFGSGFES
jgi:nucleoside-diphosphate-sugar epimerase